jgi:hypothetical protein
MTEQECLEEIQASIEMTVLPKQIREIAAATGRSEAEVRREFDRRGIRVMEADELPEESDDEGPSIIVCMSSRPSVPGSRRSLCESDCGRPVWAAPSAPPGLKRTCPWCAVTMRRKELAEKADSRTPEEIQAERERRIRNTRKDLA